MVHVCSESFECKVSAERMWHGLFKDAHSCLPKALPFHVLSVEYPHAQVGFHLPGHERLIKLRKGLCEEVDEVEKHVHKEEGVLKGEVEKVGKEEHKVAGLVEEGVHEAGKHVKEGGAVVEGEVEKVGEEVHKAAAEVVGGAEKEASVVKKKVEDVGAQVHKDAHLLGSVAHKGAHLVETEVGSATHKAVKLAETVLHKEEDEAKKAVEAVKKAVLKEEHLVVDAILKEELWIKEKIEEVDHEAFKITVTVLGGGLVGILLKHCKHTFELKHNEGGHGSIINWKTEFETLSSAIHYLYAFDKLKTHALVPFHKVEDYLFKHDDYCK